MRGDVLSDYNSIFLRYYLFYFSTQFISAGFFLNISVCRALRLFLYFVADGARYLVKLGRLVR